MKATFATLLALTALLLTAVSGHAAAARYYLVTSTADEVDANVGDGKCKTANKKCTLRAAIQEAKYGYNDHIYIPAGTYYLTIPGDDDVTAKGDLDIEGQMYLYGEGMGRTIIDGSNLDRVFHIHPATVALRDLTIQHGNAGGGTYGGGILSHGTLYLYHVEVRDNIAPQGGGIFNQTGVYLYDSVVRNNSAYFGGGIANTNDLGIIRSTISGNLVSGNGAGIQNLGGDAFATNSTIALNRAYGDGGGIYNQSANATPGTFELMNATVTKNTADDDQANGGDAGGVFNEAGSAVQFWSSIVAANLDKTPNAGVRVLDCKGTVVSKGHNLVGSATSCSGVSNNVLNDKAGSLASPLSPKLSDLQLNSGVTENAMPEANSPALDAGDDANCKNDSDLVYDQRLLVRGNGPCDMGAVEVGVVCGEPREANLFRPVPNAKVKKDKPVWFSWVAQGCATKYRLVVRQDDTQGPIVLKTKKAYGLKYTVAGFPRGHTYYWTVYACNSNGCVKTASQMFKVK